MARREKQRKTSLGNVLEATTTSETSEVWRGVSASSAPRQQRKPRLFGSVREAMEFEAAEEETARRVGRDAVETTKPLDARTLSTLEKTQADVAGYTVIRRRTVSEPAEPSLEPRQPRRRGFSDARSGGESAERRQQRGGKSSRDRRQHSAAGGDSKALSASLGRRESKRSPSAVGDAPGSVWVATTHDKAAAEPSFDEQRWLAAASAGAVLPARVAAVTSTTPVPHAASAPSAWVASPPALTAASPLREEVSSREEQAPVALDESMLSWLASALALDATRAASSPVDAGDTTSAKEDLALRDVS